MHLVGYFHSCITMLGFMNIKPQCQVRNVMQNVVRHVSVAGKVWICIVWHLTVFPASVAPKVLFILVFTLMAVRKKTI